MSVCYRNMTFCTEESCKSFGICPRSLTQAVKDSAVMWWGNEEAPIAQYIDRQDCYIDNEEKDDETTNT